MDTAFSNISTNPLRSTVASPYFVVSSNNTDTGNVSVSGLASGVGVAATVTLEGQKEVIVSQAFDSPISFFSLAAHVGTLDLYKEGVKAQGTIILTANPTDGQTLTLGLTNHTTVYTFVDALVTAYDVLIGADADETAANLRKAIRAGDAVIGDLTDEGTLYGTGTVAHPDITVSAISNNLLTLQDRLGCKRALNYVLSSTAATTLQAPIGGTNGDSIARLTSSQSQAYNSVSLDNPTLSPNIPPLLTFTSQWVAVRNAPCVIRLTSGTASTDVHASYETSPVDISIVNDGLTTIPDPDDNFQVIEPTEKYFERIRLTVENADTVPVAIDARLCRASVR